LLEMLEMPEMPEVMRRVLLCMLKALEGGLCSREASEVLEVMRPALLCMLEAVETGLSFGVSKFLVTVRHRDCKCRTLLFGRPTFGY